MTDKKHMSGARRHIVSAQSTGCSSDLEW